MSPHALYRLGWSHPYQRMCTILHTHLTRSLWHRYLSTQVSNEQPRGHNYYRIWIIYVRTLLHHIHRHRIHSTWYEWPRGHDCYGISIRSATWGKEGVWRSVAPWHAWECTAWWSGAKSDVTLQWYAIGGYGMFSQLPPALGVTRTSDWPSFLYDACEYVL